VIGLDNVDAGNIIPSAPPTNAPAVAVPTISFGKGWIPLREWTDRCGLSKPERSVSGGVTSYRVTTRNGVCRFIIGSRLAQWNGVSVWLGFAPQIVRGEPRIHALDAEKTLAPLAEMPLTLQTKTRTVVLDPGHGGTDGGTRGAHHELEKTFTLDWALRTERLLTNSGWKVFLTRRSDIDVPLTERVAFADRVRADLFISLHFNSTYPQTQPSGVETYCLTPAGMPSTLVRGYTDDERTVFPNNTFDAANVQWAFRIHHSLLAQTHAHDDGLKHARFMGVLRHQNRAAVLVEGGFLSNARDAANIQSGAYRESLAQALADALK
jgi:N-acetylmuramoyl-L-alanine amidase